ncbi:protein TolR [Aliihoeflea aestuarii]|jgi:biopolymer transport protein TolR|uniref:ExbD/TolR family protein n=1 Tax=Aliihoeflea aestuarii TaxID=453840 RepID=UPI002093F545|nr:biopolymer transporter ExbD [Aliihoeflea aestuarii]MCO6391345.1 protein TolR [Aliihoeflea aestuarii]
MGMAVGQAGGGRGHRRRGKRHALVSEINVTPFVDVMLVLLIIFMVAAPLLTVGVPIDLPESRANALNSETTPITVSVNADGQVYLQETEISIDDIVATLEAIGTTGYDERIYVRADGSANYAMVMRVLGRINGAGYRNVGLVTLPEDS